MSFDSSSVSVSSRAEGPGRACRAHVFVFILLAALMAGPAQAQEAPAPTERARRVRAVAADHERAQRRHLWRVALWGGANVATGAALMLASGRAERPARFGYGLQSGLWGAINVGIAGFGLRGGPGAPAQELDAALSSVRGYHDVLLLNTGLNVAYAGVGAAMLFAGYRGVDNAAAWRGHGTALVVQGAGLLVLDGIALWGARGRLAELFDLAGQATLSLGPAGAHLLVRF